MGYVYQPLLLRLAIALGSVQSFASQMTMVLSLPPVTSVGLSLYLVKADARIKPSCALKDVMVS
jgi:hypothetical protein